MSFLNIRVHVTYLRFVYHIFAYLTHAVSYSDKRSSYFDLVVNAEVVDTSNVSDIVFPAIDSDLDNFTAVEMNNTAHITVPAEAITTLSAANSSEG